MAVKRIGDLGSGAQRIFIPDWRLEARYGIYICEPGEPVLVATAESPRAIGRAVITLASDMRESGGPVQTYGILDGHEGRWLSFPNWRLMGGWQPL